MTWVIKTQEELSLFRHVILVFCRFRYHCTMQYDTVPLVLVPSVLWHCWLSGRMGIRPVKTEWWGTGVVICLERGANDLHMVQLMPLPPHLFLLQENPYWFTFLLLAYPGCPGERPLDGCSSVVVDAVWYSVRCTGITRALKLTGCQCSLLRWDPTSFAESVKAVWSLGGSTRAVCWKWAQNG